MMCERQATVRGSNSIKSSLNKSWKKESQKSRTTHTNHSKEPRFTIQKQERIQKQHEEITGTWSELQGTGVSHRLQETVTETRNGGRTGNSYQ